MNKEKEIILDVIPLYINEMYPTSDSIWHFKSEIKNENRLQILDKMIEEIRHKFSDYNAVIILEKGKVIEIL